MRKKTNLLVWCWAVLLAGAWGTAAWAETDFMEAAPPAGWYFQNFQIYYHAEDWARDDIPLEDCDVDAYTSLFRVARWWDQGVVHIIVPVGYTDLKADPLGGPPGLLDGQECGLGDIFVGGGRRWINEAKDCFFVLGTDLRLPSGDYHSKEDCYDARNFVGYGGFNFGSGSFSVQPFAILTKLFNEGFIASDTEVRFDLNTSAGPIQYDPDDNLEVWQNISFGVAKGLRIGGSLKGNFELEDDDGDNDHALSVAAGPAIMYMVGDIVIWGKVLFDTITNDTHEKSVLTYLRISIPF